MPRPATMAGTALIVEDHPLYRDALTQLLRRIFGDAGVAAASSAEDGLKLVASAADLRIILLDPGLPGMKGFEAITAFRRACPDVALVAISASEERRDAEAALRAGAIAFVSKAVSTEMVSDFVRRVTAEEIKEPVWLTPTGVSELPAGSVPELLTPRQVEILVLLCQGHPNKEIGLRLGLAEVTVKMHVSSVFRALGVANRTQAVIEARRLGLHPSD